ncbi:MAG: carbamoyltransferase N-terminal domain-containing protein, partial [Bacteroidota bacterium]
MGINQVPGIIGWMHDSAAAIVVDGEIIASAEEERFNRIRHSSGRPEKAIAYCLKESNLTLSDIDVVAIANNPWAPFRRLRINLHPINFLRDVINVIAFEYYRRRLKTETDAKIIFVDHHLAHAASAYLCSGQDEVNVLTIDGSGETESFAFFVGKAGRLKRIWDIPLGSIFAKKKWHSIGGVYSRLTSFLKLGVQAEGKTMGLASYGESRFDFSKILHIKKHNDYVVDRRKISELYSAYERKSKSDPLTQEHKDLAASLQKALEVSVVNLAREAYEYNQVGHFAFAGGVTLNCNTNTEVLLQDFCDSLFIQPAANDGGLALGAALFAAGEVGEAKTQRLAHAYYGPGFTNDEIETLLKEAKVPYRKTDQIAADTAALIADGKIVGWFQGRMEMGPRALG